jgi:hypothetical protein
LSVTWMRASHAGAACVSAGIWVCVSVMVGFSSVSNGVAGEGLAREPAPERLTASMPAASGLGTRGSVVGISS